MICYVIPSVDVFMIPLRSLRIKVTVEKYNVFPRNCPLLDRDYPAIILLKDAVLIKVNIKMQFKLNNAFIMNHNRD